MAYGLVLKASLWCGSPMQKHSCHHLLQVSSMTLCQSGLSPELKAPLFSCGPPGPQHHGKQNSPLRIFSLQICFFTCIPFRDPKPSESELPESSASLYYFPYAHGPLSCLSLTTVPTEKSLRGPAPALATNCQGGHLCLSCQYWTVPKAGALTCMRLWGSGSTSSNPVLYFF